MMAEEMVAGVRRGEGDTGDRNSLERKYLVKITIISKVFSDTQ